MEIDPSSLDGLPDDHLLKGSEVAALFRVDPKTVARWAKAGRITSIRTPGRHRRFQVGEIRPLLRGGQDGRHGS